jgi:enoyl-CoA hydratase
MVDYGRYRYILVNKDDGVATVTLNRPERLNAVDTEFHSELEDLFVDISNDDEIRAVVLTGAGRAFCAGGDAKSMDTGEFSQPSKRVPFFAARRLLLHLLEVEQPMVAAVNGDAAGLGATLALFCDIIIASETARIGDTHVKMGLVAGDGGVVIWPLLVGMARAKEFLLTGDFISGKEAERIGLVNRAVPPDEVMPAATAMARRLAEGAPLAIRWTKFSLNKLLRDQVNLSVDTSLFLEAATMETQDLREAAKAFLEKRPPRFQGA